MSAIEASERLGLPEARIPLGEIVCEMALSPKSNSSHIALDKALEDVKRGNIGKAQTTSKLIQWIINIHTTTQTTS